MTQVNDNIDLAKILEGYTRTHTAIIYGRKERKVYRSRCRNRVTNWGSMVLLDEPEEDKDFIELVKIGEYEISNPPFTRYDRMFLHELGVSTSINTVERSTADKWIYQVQYVVELIDDEETLRSYEKALAEIEKYNQERKPEPRSNPRDFDDKKRWWKFWTW